jgi:hypothetical protein
MTALQSGFWQLQLYKHFQRFYPEWIRSIECRNIKSQGLYFYRHRPILAEKEFNQLLQSSSVDHALESALNLLTSDLPEPVYPEVLRILDDLKVEELTDDAVLNICDQIRQNMEEVTAEKITIQLVQKYLTTQPIPHGKF